MESGLIISQTETSDRKARAMTRPSEMSSLMWLSRA